MSNPCQQTLSSPITNHWHLWKSWETTFSRNLLKLKKRTTLSGKTMLSLQFYAQAVQIGASSEPTTLPLLKRQVNSQNVKSLLQDCTMYFLWTIIYFLVPIKKEKKNKRLVILTPTGFWSAFINTLSSPIFEKKLLNIHHKYFVNSHFCLILATSTFIVIIQWILFSMVEKRSLIGGMESNPASQAWTKPQSGSCFQDRPDIPPWHYGFPFPHNLWTFKSNWN